ncbi:DUF397 domain-containing protein [Streptomonospora salina]|uniref:DUF397 domain-containing protein n=1 Tax=Streptomonospora salina TaxID=104205 RepID=A0A841EBD8_9ACTN|nr:DUF397 domain-containing protein [Streptomonospora salina]MBB5997810.1 hypothetical protein [Streptomonospora salina]
MRSIPETLYRKSTYSTSNNCVEVADIPGISAVRDTKAPEAGALEFPATEWRALIEAVRSGEL